MYINLYPIFRSNLEHHIKYYSDPYGLGMGRASTVSNASLVRLHDFFLKVKSVSTYK